VSAGRVIRRASIRKRPDRVLVDPVEECPRRIGTRGPGRL